MYEGKYIYFIEKANKDFSELINIIQEQLNISESKGEDLYILNTFWGEFMPKAIEKWPNSSIMFLDNEAIMPMPESVSKQFVSRIFEIKHLNPLMDLCITTGFEDYEYYKDSNKDQIIASYNENLNANRSIELEI